MVLGLPLLLAAVVGVFCTTSTVQSIVPPFLCSSSSHASPMSVFTLPSLMRCMQCNAAVCATHAPEKTTLATPTTRDDGNELETRHAGAHWMTDRRDHGVMHVLRCGSPWLFRGTLALGIHDDPPPLLLETLFLALHRPPRGGPCMNCQDPSVCRR